MMQRQSKKICLGAIAGAHGVRGEFKIKTFTERPMDVAAYGPATTEDGKRTFTLQIIRDPGDGFVLARAPEVTSREDAQRLKGVRLYVDRNVLPDATDDEFYYEDLVGLRVITETGDAAGRVAAVYNFGAGDLLELAELPDRKSVMVLPFTKGNFPAVDIASGEITIARAAIDGAAEDPATTLRFQEAATRAEDA